jgi:tetratricopeptide (TPR) repeat protein
LLTQNQSAVKTFSFLFLLFSSLVLHAQVPLDSLYKALETAKTDSVKLLIREKLYSAELYRQPHTAKKHVQRALQLSAKLGLKEREVQAVYGLATYYYLIKEIDTAAQYYKKALAMGKESDQKEMIAKSISSLAIIEANRGNFDRALAMRDTANALLKEIKSYLNYGIGVGERARLYVQKSNYTLAYNESLKALRILDTINREIYRRADIYVQLGSIEHTRNKYDSALEYYQKALQIFINTDDEVYQSNTYLSMGRVFYDTKIYKQAIVYLEKARTLAEKHRLKGTYAESLGAMGMVQLDLGNYDEANSVLNEALAFNRRFKIMPGVIYNLIHLGRTAVAEGNTNKSLKYLDEAWQIADSMKLTDQKPYIYRAQGIAYREAGRFKEAYDAVRNYHRLKDSIDNTVNARQIEELMIMYDTEKKEAALALQEEEIKTLNAQTENDRLTKTLYGGGAVAGLALSGLLFFGFRQRIKKNQIEREKQEEIYRQEIAFKRKELASQTLHLVQKNTFIQELKENLERLKSSPEKFKMEFRRIVMLLKKENAAEKDWEVFKSYFTEVHNNFDHKLMAFNADLSEKDLRLASFIKMNLSTKEIAAILNVLPQSILTSKYRLKKKLNLAKEEDLYGFLSGL